MPTAPTYRPPTGYPLYASSPATTSQLMSPVAVPAAARSGWAARPTTPTMPSKSPLPDFFGTGDPTGSMAPGRFPKVPGADPVIEDLFGRASRYAGSGDATISKYTDLIGATQPRLEDQFGRESDFLRSVYEPTGIASDLARIRAGRKTAMSNLDSYILGDMRRALGLNAAGSGGVAGAGLGGWLAGQAASTAGRLRAQEAYDAADAERQDTASLLAARMGASGRLQALQDPLVERTMLPLQKQAVNESLIQQLVSQALQNALANSQNFYGTPV